MPSRHSVVALASLAAMGLTTGCEKQNPIVTMTAHGVVVKARAAEYCRGDDCRRTTDNPTLKLHPDDTLGIDVPRSLAEQGWHATVSVGPQSQELFDVVHDHYRAEKLGRLPPGQPLVLTILRADPEKHGAGEWRFTLVAG